MIQNYKIIPKKQANIIYTADFPPQGCTGSCQTSVQAVNFSMGKEKLSNNSIVKNYKTHKLIP